MSSYHETNAGYASDARAEIAELREKVETLMQTRVAPALSALSGEAQAVAQAATDTAKEQVTRLSDTVKDQPLAAIGIAAAAGFVLAMLYRR